MSDDELRHAICRLAIIVKHMDTEGVLGTELDGIFDWAKSKVMGVKKIRELRNWAFDNTKPPTDDFTIPGMQPYKTYTDSLATYKSLETDLVGTIKINKTYLTQAEKLSRDQSKQSAERAQNLDNLRRFERLQSAYTDKQNACKQIIKQLDIIIERYQEAFNEWDDYQFRVANCQSENATLTDALTKLGNADQLIKNNKDTTQAPTLAPTAPPLPASTAPVAPQPTAPSAGPSLLTPPK